MIAREDDYSNENANNNEGQKGDDQTSNRGHVENQRVQAVKPTKRRQAGIRRKHRLRQLTRRCPRWMILTTKMCTTSSRQKHHGRRPAQAQVTSVTTRDDTNPHGIYNAWSGTWDPPPGHRWNGKYWYEPMKTEQKRSTTAASKPASAKPQAKTKSKREPVVSSGDESDTRPRRKRVKAVVKQIAGDKDG
ncbi:uncharacterized protein IUM83_05054 [Phytophthora cinnamomi]|uniref:uncharacterized protein n=1 Tax=Phytophthora cinnamomi TaxID=4785 RepID=UPI0035596C8C|nr:hypothetical protein IUM83_05054 [Phytophthora cinnamomi]